MDIISFWLFFPAVLFLIVGLASTSVQTIKEGVQMGHSPLTVSPAVSLKPHSNVQHNALQSDELTDQ